MHFGERLGVGGLMISVLKMVDAKMVLSKKERITYFGFFME